MIQDGYGLRDIESKELVGISIRSNEGGDCCGEFTHELSYNSDIPWIVKDKLTASHVRLNSTAWYNAEYETPINNIESQTLEVVKIEIKITPEEPIQLPTFEEYMQRKFLTKGIRGYDPGHYEWIMKEHKLFPQRISSYSIYDIQDLLWMEEKNHGN
jgi:hypothetical protein